MGKYCRKVSEFHIVKFKLSPAARKITDAISSEEIIAMARAGRLYSTIKEYAYTIGEYRTSEEYKKIAWEVEDEVERLDYIVSEEVINPEHKFKEFLKLAAYQQVESKDVINWYADFDKNWGKYFFSLRKLKYAKDINMYYERYDFEEKRELIFEILWNTLPHSQYDVVVFSLLHDGEYELTTLEQQAYACAERNVYRNLLCDGQLWDLLEERS